MNTSLFEMAYQRKIAIEKVRNLQDTLADHLIKVLIFPHSRSVNHWYNEINSYLTKINIVKIKPHGERFFDSHLFDILFDEPMGTEEDLTDRIRLIKSEYPRLKMSSITVDQLKIELMNILNNVCRDLSLGEVRDIREYL